MNTTYQPRDWQAKSFKIIDRVLSSSEKRSVIPVNACVGSGKTDLACYAFGKFIEAHRNEKTVQVFVSPRIKLCAQQEDVISSFIDANFPLKCNEDYKVISINCTDDEFNRKSGELNSQHAIFVFCDASLWGTEQNTNGDPEIRWHRWMHNFNSWREENGCLFGTVFYDESHNYENNADKISTLRDLFHLTLLASGTPAHFQKALSKEFKKNTCSCSPAEAMEKKMICKPSLNMVRGSADHDFPNAIRAVLKREAEICKSEEVFTPCILVNCDGIDKIKSIIEHPWISERIGKEFHVLTIHCWKHYQEDNEKKVFDCRIDNEVGKSSGEVYDVIESLDKNYFKDTLPILVFQVGMIGEGINVKCFNSVIVTTHTDRTAMQQIGRAIRNCVKGDKSKIENGHASVYAFMENIEELQRLIVNLQQYDLTDECFTWGKIVDVSSSSAPEHNSENDPDPKLHDFDWSDIDDIDIEEIIRAADIKCTKRHTVEFYETLLNESPELISKLVKALTESGYLREFGYKHHGITKFNSEKFHEEAIAHKEKLLECSSEKAERKVQKSKEEESIRTTSDLIIEHLIMLKNYATSRKCLFSKLYAGENKKKILTKVLGSKILGKFFADTLPDEMVKKWVK